MDLPLELHNRFVRECFDLSEKYNIGLMQIHSIIIKLEHDKNVLLKERDENVGTTYNQVLVWERGKIDLLVEDYKKVLLKEDLLSKDAINEFLLLWKFYQ